MQYILLFLANILLLIVCAAKRKKMLWAGLYIFEMIGLATTWVLAQYYDSLPGTGKAPGLTYFGEVMNCLFGFAAFTAALIITAIVHVIIRYRTRRCLR